MVMDMLAILEILLHTVVFLGIGWLDHLHVSVNSLRDGMDLNHIALVSEDTIYVLSLHDGLSAKLGIYTRN